MNSLLLGLRKETRSVRSLLIAALLCVSSLITSSLVAKGSCPIFITTIAESSAGCRDGAIVVNTSPSGQSVCVQVNPGDFSFTEVTPATLRPAGTPGFPAGTYNVKASTKNNRLKKCVTIPVAHYGVTVPPVTDAHCSCNGAFETIFDNPDHADVKVTYQATSGGTVIGTTGVYTHLCPGTYEWTVQANSKSAACNHKVVFKKTGVVTIGGTGPVENPEVTPATQIVPQGKPIFFSTTPELANATYRLYQVTASGPLLRATQSTGNFEISSAKLSDDGSYFVTLQVDDCPVTKSDTVTVMVTSSACKLSMSLTPLSACNPATTGGIKLTYSGSTTGVVELFVNNVDRGPLATSPFIITPLAAPATYTVKIVDKSIPNCFAQSSVSLEVITPPAPSLSSTPTCQGQPFTMTVMPAGQPSYTLTLPDGSEIVQLNGLNTFQFFDASAAVNNGAYSATYIDSNGCMSGPSNTVTVMVKPVPFARLMPAVEGVTLGSTIFFNVSPVLFGASYSLFTPNIKRGNNGVITQSSPNFLLPSAAADDIGTYFAVITTADGCVSNPSDPSTVVISGTCDLTIGLTPVPACSESGTGSILLQFMGGSGTSANLFVNGTSMGQVTSPFSIGNLTPNMSYTVRIVDSNILNCSNQATTEVKVVPPVTPVLTAVPACTGSPLSMTVTPSNGVSYTLTKVGGPSITQPSNVFLVSQSATSAVNGAYSATFIDQNGCTQGPSNTVTISVNPKPLVALAPNFQTTPVGGAALFTVTTNLTGPGLLFVLTDPNGNTHTQSTGDFVISPAIAGTYTAVVINNGCPSDPSDPATVAVGGCLPFSLTPQPECTSKALGSIIVDVSDHTPPFSYTVNGGQLATATSSPFTILDLDGGASYTVTVTDATGCSATGSVTIPLQPSPPQATLAPATQIFIPGGTLTFTAGPTGLGANCFFSLTTPNPDRGTNGVVTQTSPDFIFTDITAADLGSYSVVLNCGGCPSDPSVPVTVVPPTCSLSVTDVTTTSSCGASNVGNGSLQITVQGGIPPYFYSADGINFSQPTNSTTATIFNLPSGTYNNITVKDSSTPQCTAKGPSTTIAAMTPPALTITGNSFVPVGSTIALTAVSAAASANYTWTGPNNFTASTAAIAIPAATAANSGVYTVAAASAAAAGAVQADQVCINQASILVTVGLAPIIVIKNSSSKTLCNGTCTSFVVTVKNTGAATATNLVLTDIFPSAITVTRAQGEGWTIKTTAYGLQATLPSLAPGQSASIMVNVKSNAFSGGQELQSVATVTSDTTPVVSATATITTACCPNLCK